MARAGLGLSVFACSFAGAEQETIEPGEPPNHQPSAAAVRFTINTADRHAISPYVYGMNFVEQGGSPPGVSPWEGAVVPPEVTMNRFGGNRLSAFNWETGWSNVGADGDFSNDAYLTSNGASYNYGSAIGAAVAGRVNASFANNRGIILTIPMLGFVAGNAAGRTLGTTDRDRNARLAEHFYANHAFKATPLSLSPSLSDRDVYQDEFVHWVNQTWPNHATNARQPIFFSLDNEPDLWSTTHKEVQSDSADDANRPRLLTYEQLAETSIVYARAVKSVMPDALVFGPAVATYAGVVSGGRYTDRWHDDPKYGQQNFLDVYLDRMRQAETTHGRRLLDVLDVHYYPAAGDGRGEVGSDRAVQSDSMGRARMQSPRSLWDPSYVEGSWVNSVTDGAIRLLPRLRAQIAAHYPGTRLAITEYYFGRAGDITGGLAQADVLGIFGREGVFAANLWPNADVSAAPYNGEGKTAYAYAFGAFRLFLNFDGAGAKFGSTGVAATTSDNTASSVYASLDDQDRVIVIVINKSKNISEPATISISDARALTRVVGVYHMAEGSPSPIPVSGANVTTVGRNQFTYVMPALSATVIVLAPQ